MGSVKNAKVFYPKEIEKVRVESYQDAIGIKFYTENEVFHMCLNEKQTKKLLKHLIMKSANHKIYVSLDDE